MLDALPHAQLKRLAKMELFLGFIFFRFLKI